MLTIFCFIVLTQTSYAQLDITGEWHLAPLKKVIFKEDLSFELKKGVHIYKGHYNVKEDNDAVILDMHFVKQTISYTLIKKSKTEIDFIENETSKVLHGKKTVIQDEETFPIGSNNQTHSSPNVNSNKIELNTNIDTDKTHDNQFLFSLNIGGRINQPSAAFSVFDTTYINGNITSKTSNSPGLHYNGGLKIGYKLNKDFYLGSGAQYTFYNYNAKQTITLNDPIYQYDSESTQSAKYSLNLIEVPLWINFKTESGLRFETGGQVIFPFKNKSSAVFNSSTQTYVNGQIDTDNSFTNQEYKRDFPDLVENISYGAYFEVQKHFSKTFGVSLGYRYTKNYTFFDSQPVTNHSFTLNFIIQLF